jgi:choline dehydrogenase-like flavoprotein
MMYFRGQPADYDEWQEAGLGEWGWDSMARAFQAMESHQLGADEVRGGDGPLRISINPGRNPISQAMVKSGTDIGLPFKTDLNRPEQEGIGFAPWTISNGRRMSAATAFLKPARRQKNLQILTGVEIGHVVIENGRATGVSGKWNGRKAEWRTSGEVLVCAGALRSPGLLERSGIGNGERLHGLGIPVIHHSPDVGEHMMEHRLLMMQYRVKKPVSNNREFSGWRLFRNVLRYYLHHTGVLAEGSFEVGAFVRAQPGANRPDTEILMAPFSMEAAGKLGKFEKQDGIQIFGYPLRSRSEGSVHIRSADPETPSIIRPAYLTDPYDREITIAMFRYIRTWLSHPSLRDLIAEETLPGPGVQSDDEILEQFRSNGNAAYHACSTCKMGSDARAVLDGRARVRGVAGLRVIDGSMLPSMLSANTNGPIMAMAWRAADLILEDSAA